MGRSKFPGKPSRLVMKDRVRVLVKNESPRKLNKRKRENCSSCNNIVNCDTKKKKTLFENVLPIKKTVGSAQSNIASFSKSLQETTNDILERNCDHNFQRKSFLSDLSQHKNKTLHLTEQCRVSPTYVGNVNPKATDKNNHQTKKTVTFKNILETSDDKLLSRSIHNPLNKGPLVSIMKKKCINSHHYIPRKNKIVRPSRLTRILKNNANIDKTKFLSFRSVHMPMLYESKKQLDEQNANYSSACKIYLTVTDGKKKEPKLKKRNDTAENSEKMTNTERYNQLTEKWNQHTLEHHKDNCEIAAPNKEVKQLAKKKEYASDGQIILRQPRLIFESQEDISLDYHQKVSIGYTHAYQKVSNDKTVPTCGDTVKYNNAECGVCCATLNYENVKQGSKYSITSCDLCRTFLSKMQKNTDSTSLNSSKPLQIQCLKTEGECLVSSLSKIGSYSFKEINNGRCSACWLKECIKSFHFPSGHNLRLSSLITEAHNKDINSINKSEETLNFSRKIDLSQKCATGSRTIFNWQGNLLANKMHESPQQKTVDTNFIENIVNDHVQTLLFSKATPSYDVDPTLNTGSIPTSDYPRRQKIAFKGPRVKHVCRSASIALGQQMATFSNGNDEALSLLHCSSEIENGFTDDLSQSLTDSRQIQTKYEVKGNDCKNNYLNVFNKKINTCKSSIKVDTDNQEDAGKKCMNDQENLDRQCFGINNAINDQNHSEPKRNSLCIGKGRREKKSKMILIEFWNTYVPAEVNQTGFGLILTKPSSASALCFLCGSMDLINLLFCVCCCEPYHSYCIQEAFTENSVFIDKKDVTNQFLNQLNWICPRCTVCETCNMSSGTKIKCQKCRKDYHNTCLGTSKGLLGADRPLICKSCLKCQYCSTSKVSKYVGNQPTCVQCFVQRRSSSTCSLCQKCVDSVSEIVILDCVICKEFIHAKCEGLTEEETNLCSSISDDIKFVCNKCAISNYKSKTLSKQWKEAISKELKSRLLLVLKLLSKSRVADLLKKSIQNCFNCNFAKVTKNHHKTEYLNEYNKYKSNNIIGSNYLAECLCSQSNNPQQANNSLSLLDIKKKILNGEYLSLYDFNSDMQEVISQLKNDELVLIYKEIISETFSWFQNETKSCTDALEEDMFDFSNYSFQAENIITENENMLNKVSFSIPKEKIFTLLKQNIDSRFCVFCHKEGDADTLKESRLLYYGFDSWVHVNCALLSKGVYEEIDGSLQNVHQAFIRGRLTRCTVCKNSGATIKCNVKTCCNYYHFNCAKKTECLFEFETSIICPLHSMGYEKKKYFDEYPRVSRPLHIECNKSHSRFVEPFKAQFILGSLSVLQLGTIILPFSDTEEAIVPINFVCTRLYWSIKEPWKVIKYRVRTSIQNNSISKNNTHEINFTVDHTKQRHLVEKDMAQISNWHNTLIQNDNLKTSLKKEHNFLNHLRFSMNAEYRNENPLASCIEEEPQNNTNLLPPEIEDAIFEDLPSDVLEGISMLDIFPKLMIHEHLEDLGGKTKKKKKNYSFLPSIDYNSSMTKQDINYLTQIRDIQSNNSEHSIKTVDDYRSKIKSCSLSWAIDSTKFTNDICDLNFTERRSAHLNSIKSDDRFGDNNLNSRTHFSSEENNNLIQLKKDNKIVMQLDGADDQVPNILNEGISNISLKNSVKCNRCHFTYRTLNSFQRHLTNCEQISTSESETDTSSRSPDSKNSMVVVDDGLNMENLQLYKNQFETSVKPDKNLKSFSMEPNYPPKVDNTASFCVHINEDCFLSHCVNTANNSNEKKENIMNNETNNFNSETKTEQSKLFHDVKENTMSSSLQINKAENDLHDKSNYYSLNNQNLIFSEQYSQQHPQQQFFIIQQNASNSQPMLVNQVPNEVSTLPQNIFPVVLSNNSMQYASVPSFTNSLAPSSIWQSDYNVMLSAGLQILPIPTVQLVSPTSQSVGPFNLPQTLQLDLNQVLLGADSTVDIIPNTNPLLLASQPLFYGLETIVQNTVTSSQQFISTAIQGVLSQNASFSATTTQVFQSSKFEPVNDTSPNIVVLNNIDGSAVILPQTNMLPGFLHMNRTQDIQNSYKSDFGQMNPPYRQDTNQQSKVTNIFSPIEALPEIAITEVKAPRIELQDNVLLKTSSNTLPPTKIIVQDSNLLFEKWLGKSTPNEKEELYDTNVSKIKRNVVNEGFFSYAKNLDLFEVQNKCSEFSQEILNHKVHKTPKSIKGKNSVLSFSQVGFKTICKHKLKKKSESNRPQYESTIKDSSVNCSSSTQNINIRDCPNNPETQNSKTYRVFKESMKSIPISVTRSSVEMEKPVKLRSMSLVHSTSSIGGSLKYMSTNKEIPIRQQKKCNNITSRPTNRVLPMQSIHSATPKPASLENEFCKKNETVDNKFEYVKPMKEDVRSTDSTSNLVAITDYLSTKNSPSHNINLFKKTDTNENSEFKYVHTSNMMKNNNKESSVVTLGNENSVEANISESNDFIKTLSNIFNNDSSDKIARTRVDKYIKSERQEKGDYDTQPISIDKNEEFILKNDFEILNKTLKSSMSSISKIPYKLEADQQSNVTFASKKDITGETNKNNIEPYLIFEIQSEDGFSYKSQSISHVWEKVFEDVQNSRRAHGLPFYSIGSFADICGVQMLGLKTSALKYLIEQLPGIEQCQRYTPKYHENEASIKRPIIYNGYGMETYSKYRTAARCESFSKRSSYDIFSWLASKHRKQPKQIFVQPSDTELIARRCTANLPMAMKYRTLKETCKQNVGVFRSLIHGRGLFCVKDMEAGEMVIEYAGELIRSTLADKRERFYDSKEIGCYMFKIDEQFVVDATMRGNAARFINHSCEPNCYSKVVDILGHKHIIIFSIRRIVQGEELTYDYKFPFEDLKIHCYCASKKCRKYLN